MAANAAQSAVPVEALASALAAALPTELRERAPALAAALAATTSGNAQPAQGLDPALKTALRALAGKEVQGGGVQISFGSGNQFGDVTIGDVVGGDRITVRLELPASQLSPRDQRNRRAMLARLRATWVDGLLARTFAEVGRAPIALLARPEAVARPLADAVQELAPEGDEQYSDVVAAFDAAGGGLLILGQPGAGKTVALIELARALLERAEADETRPIPVILPLSSWAARRLPLGEWLVEALLAEYDVPRAVGVAWRDADALLPLLDGLDEVDDAHRPACAEALNSYRAGSLTPLVVSCRSDEYRELAHPLRLEAAVELAPLDQAGISQALAGAGPQGAAVAPLLEADPELADLAANPLMLAVISEALADGEHVLPEARCGACGRTQRSAARFCPACGAAVARDPGALRAALVAAYVERVFVRGDATTRLPRPQIVAALGWLAATMATQRRSSFHLEDLQPEWLPDDRSRRTYNLLDRTAGTVIAGMLGLMVMLPLGLVVGTTVLPTDPWVLYVLGGLLFGGIAVSGPERPGRQLLGDVLRGGLAGLLGGVLLGALGFVLDEQRRAVFEVLALPPLVVLVMLAAISGMIGMLAGVLYGLLSGPPGLGPRRIVPVERLRWSWRWGLRSVPLGIAAGGGGGALFGLLIGLVAGPLLATAAVPELEELGQGINGMLVLTVASAIVFGIGFAAVGALFGLLGGVLGGLRAGSVSARPVFGGPLRRSAHTALLAALIFALLSAGLSLLNIELGQLLAALAGAPQTMAWQTRLYGVVSFGLQAAIVGALCFGGYAVLSHLALRLILARRGLLPWRLRDLLEEGAERTLLRSAGDGYLFRHRLFLDHFAAQEKDARP